MKKTWIALLAATLMIGTCSAQDNDAAKRAKVEELMTTMHVDSMIGQMMTMARAQIDQTARSVPGYQTMTPAQKKVYDDFQTKALDLVTQAVGWKAIEPEMVKLYTENFTIEEIDGIVAFYKSTPGQALIHKSPQLMQQITQSMQSRIGDLQPRMKVLTDQFAKDMAAAGPTPKS